MRSVLSRLHPSCSQTDKGRVGGKRNGCGQLKAETGWHRGHDPLRGGDILRDSRIRLTEDVVPRPPGCDAFAHRLHGAGEVGTAEETIVRTARIGNTAVDATAVNEQLSTRRLNIMRFGYAFMGVGLVIVKWPLLLDAPSLPVMEGVVTCLLTAMSLLAFLGLRYPVGMLPILLFEVAWKLIWIGTVGIPTWCPVT